MSRPVPKGWGPQDLADLSVVEGLLNQRWPETKIDPTTERMVQLVEALGSPQRSYPAVHVAGTNGKTSVSRMIDALLTRLQLRTGRTTSPHLQVVTERISIDGAPISPARFVDTYADVAPFLDLVDASSAARGGPPLSTFEVLTAMAFAAFAEAPVDVAVVEVGMGGRWDATNVVDGQVAVITPIAVDHVEYLGSDLGGIAGEKAGIIKAGSVAVMAQQSPEVGEVLLRRAVEVDASVAREGAEFSVLSRAVAVGGQLLTLQGLGAIYPDVFLPLHGAHQARNAALALAAVEAFFGAGPERALPAEAVRDAFASVTSPGRLERVRNAPSVFLDAAHNPHGATALAVALDEEFDFRKLVGVVAVMADKDAPGLLAALEPVLDEVVVTRSASPRAMDVEVLAAHAVARFGDERVVVVDDLAGAIETAVAQAEEAAEDEAVSGSGVVVTGSVVTVGEARTLLGKDPA
ncbi:bifunctional folylpolyglutamate synthase/dihydrofolate synthase [Rhodococcus antarcticus]|uniref:tetrahydrofolate synthase n=1 Tax=Rhodococcus antarcticus TaxID=2987751 RepID=A0ABY6NWP2_9NOCA|nr:folylpolyglutamate synthase/dihydrofolate synthase family protein [Rhodococcus antarcticus]UZJ23812.1 bifunctional folylpolyglutamate synthase/dihydrofolate synthase [Rhodococcus antarcticus]